MTTNYVLFDISTLRYKWNDTRDAVSVRTLHNEHLATITVETGTSDRRAAFLACDATLATTWVRRNGTRHRVALYNPHTAQISVDATPKTTIYSDRRPVAIPADGTTATRTDAGLTLRANTDRTIPTYNPTVQTTIAAWTGTPT